MLMLIGLLGVVTLGSIVIAENTDLKDGQEDAEQDPSDEETDDLDQTSLPKDTSFLTDPDQEQSTGTVDAPATSAQADAEFVPTTQNGNDQNDIVRDSLQGLTTYLDSNGVEHSIPNTPSAGDDRLIGTDDTDSLAAGDGRDSVFLGLGDDTAQGEAGADTLHGGLGEDQLFGGTGDDALHGGDGNDGLNGGANADNLYGQSGDDSLLGGDGSDSLLGGAGDDTLHGQAGNDTLHGHGGHDVLLGGAGKDLLFGGDGNDLLDGRETETAVSGQTADDSDATATEFLNGGAGDDTIYADADDQITGGQGNDTIHVSQKSGAPIIWDFERGTDTLVVLYPSDAQSPELTLEELPNIPGGWLVKADGETVAQVMGTEPQLADIQLVAEEAVPA